MRLFTNFAPVYVTEPFVLLDVLYIDSTETIGWILTEKLLEQVPHIFFDELGVKIW